MPPKEISVQRLKYGYVGGGIVPRFVSSLSTNASSELIGEKNENILCTITDLISESGVYLEVGIG